MGHLMARSRDNSVGNGKSLVEWDTSTYVQIQAHVCERHNLIGAQGYHASLWRKSITSISGEINHQKDQIENNDEAETVYNLSYYQPVDREHHVQIQNNR